MPYKILLFDADGVLTIHTESFSTGYARQKNIDYANFRAFFQGPFQDALVGEADLKQLILEHEDLWQTNGNVDGLLDRWFAAENLRNEPLLVEIEKIRKTGIPCYLATNQEQYRGEYLKNTMFAGLFDDYFVSAALGSKKPSQEFFLAVLKQITNRHPATKASDILFIDDSPEHIEGALALGINAHLYESVEQLKLLLSS